MSLGVQDIGDANTVHPPRVRARDRVPFPKPQDIVYVEASIIETKFKGLRAIENGFEELGPTLEFVYSHLQTPLCI